MRSYPDNEVEKLRRYEDTKMKRQQDEKGRMPERKTTLKHFRDLEVYQKVFKAAMRIYEITKSFPNEERYSLVDQIRRSSRAVCSNLAEAWRKRKYEAVFKNKLTT